MSRYSKSDILRAMDDVIDGTKPLYAWDGLVSTPHEHPLTRYWAERCKELEVRHSGKQEGTLITDEGVKELVALRNELAAASDEDENGK